ncbi:MAG: hypothetical protein U1C96_13525 [Gallionella sp.]|nr:hypothetical protein [Gallionella sp.]
MKVSEYALALQSEHSRSEYREVRESLRMWVDRPVPVERPSVRVEISVEAQNLQSGESSAIEEAAKEVENSPEMLLIRSLVEMLTGKKMRLFDAGQLKTPDAVQVADPNSARMQAPSAPRAGYGVDYRREEHYQETETTSMQAQGVIKTSDGKEIQFDLKLLMQRQYSESSSTRILMGDAPRKTDPLVINFNGTAAQLSEKTFAFDLNSDGNAQQISQLLSGSGYLALDLNGNAKIDNGKELFGPASGNGFSELAQYDSDANGWIDEADPVFDKLKVWLKDISGQDTLKSLAELGVGAISLHAVETPFDLKTTTNRLLGSVVASSVYLNENGSAGSVQQVDLVA